MHGNRRGYQILTHVNKQFSYTFRMKRDKVLLILSLFTLGYWLLDVYNIIFLIQKPQFALWYSSAGLLFTSIALLSQNPILISIMFCTLFVGESVWTLDFLTKLFFDKDLLGMTNYLFDPAYTRKDFAMAMYHVFIPPVLLVAMIQIKKVFRYSWIGSTVYASTIALLTFFLVNPREDINCIHQLSRCEGLFASILSYFPYPHRILVAVLFLVVVVYVPTNYVLLLITKKRKWTEV